MMRTKSWTLFFLLVSALIAKAQAPRHNIWDGILQQYVTSDGRVNYKGLLSERKRVQTYLDILSKNPPKNTWTKNERLAYWINAYNAFTVKLILDHYPINSIKDLNPVVSIPLVNTIWQDKFIEIGNSKLSLDDIEHSILRKDFAEPRIHFAINCASISCSVLLNEAYTPDKLEGLLQQQTIKFVNDTMRNKIEKKRIVLSQVFNWFTKDFTKNGTLIAYINKYSTIKVDKDAALGFMDYDWRLNE